MAGGVEYQVTKVDPTDPQTKGMVHQVHKVSEEIAATIGGKVYRARIINDPTAPTVAGKVYQIVLIDDPDDPSVKGMVYNAILTGGSEAVVVGPAVSPLSLPDAVAGDLDYVKAFGGTEQNGTPTPTVPVDIISNNGALKATRPSGLPVGYTALEYIESNGTQYIDLGAKGNGTTKVEIKFKYHTATSTSGSGRVFGSRNAAAVDAFAIGSASGTASTNSTIAFFFGNQSYLVTDKSLVLDEWLDVVFDKTTHSINGTDYGTPYNDETFETPQNLKLFGFDNNNTMGYGYVDIAYCKLWNNGVLVRDLVPAKNSSGVLGLYDRANNQFYDNDGTGDFVAGPNAVDPITLTTVGTTETIATKANGQIISSATAEMLLKVNGYQDEQEILSGAVTRNIGVLVLDGTESWQLATATDLVQFYTQSTQGVITNNVSLTSTIAPYGCTVATRTQYDFGCYSDGSGNLCFQMKGSATLTTVSAWTQYLADQYAAGTPVIVLYPLPTPTTETVTGQTLQVQDGDNTLEITQASLTGLELEAEYEKEVE